MKYLKILLLLVLAISLTVTVYADEAKIDPDPVNLLWPDVFYDARDYGTWSYWFEGGAEGRSGAYLQIVTGVVLGDSLESYDDVIRVIAKHLDTGMKFHLYRDASCEKYMGMDVQFWYLFVRPEDWMLNGTWKFILIYKDSVGEKHRQVDKKEMGITAYPMKPSHIQVTESDDKYIISWSAIGDPSTDLYDYRVRIFEEGCGLAEVRGDWAGGDGWFIIDVNRVYFPVEKNYIGNSYLIRLENRFYHPGPLWQTSRAIQYLRLH